MSVFKRWNGTSWETIGPQISSTRFDDISHMIAPEYSSTDTYNVGDYVVQSDNLYKCISAIESAEEWTPTHWNQILISGEVSDLNSALTHVNLLYVVDPYSGTNPAITNNGDGTYTFDTSSYGTSTWITENVVPEGNYFLSGTPYGFTVVSNQDSYSTGVIARSEEGKDVVFYNPTKQRLFFIIRTNTRPIENFTITPEIYYYTTKSEIDEKFRLDETIMKVPYLLEWEHVKGYVVNNVRAIDVSQPYTSTRNFSGKSTFTSCNPGDVFYISLKGPNINARTYGFFDVNGNVLSYGDYNVQHYLEKITAPENATYVSFNSNADEYGFVLVGENPIEHLNTMIETENAERVTEVSNVRDTLTEKTSMLQASYDIAEFTGYVETEWEQGKINSGNNQSSDAWRRSIKNYQLHEGDVIFGSHIIGVTYFPDESIRGKANRVAINGIYYFEIRVGNIHIVTSEEAGVYLAFCQGIGTVETSSEMIENQSFVIIRASDNPYLRLNDYPYLNHFFDKTFAVGVNKIPFYAKLDWYIGDCVVVDGVLEGTGYQPSKIHMNQVQNGPFTNPNLTQICDCVTRPFRLIPGQSYGQNTKGGGVIAYFYDARGYYLSNTTCITSIGPSNLNRNIEVPENAEYVVLGYYHGTQLMLTEPSVYVRDYQAPIIELNTVDNRVQEEKTLQENADAETVTTINEVQSADQGFLRFVHVTDTHQSVPMTYHHKILFEKMIETAKSLSCDFIVHTGDIINGGTGGTKADWENSLLGVKDVFSKADCPVIICRGNHDDNTVGSDRATAYIGNDWFNNKLIYDINAKNSEFVKPDGANGYFYLDFPRKKIRIISMNASDLTDAERAETGGQNWMKISQDQMNWLENEALVVESGWKIICFSHVHACMSGPNSGLENAGDLRALLQQHSSSILGYFFGHTHTSADFVEDSIRWISVNSGAKGGGGGFGTQGYSKVTDEAKAVSPTGPYLFDIVEVYRNGDIKRYRWGVQDDYKTGATPPVYENDEGT